MKKAFLLVLILFVSVISTACVNNMAVQQLNTKAKTFLDNGDYDNAISRLKASLDLDGTIFETHYNLGIAYTQAEKYPDAVKTFQDAIKLRPDFADAYYSLGVAEENYGKGIIEGELKSDGTSLKNENEKSSEEATEEEAPAKKVKLTQIDKDKIAELFTDAVTNYQTYLDKGKNIDDAQEVQEKIEYLKAQSEQYSLGKN